MALKTSKGKRALACQGNKRSWMGQSSQPDVAPCEPARSFGLLWVEKDGQKWFKENKEAKYFPNKKIDRVGLAAEFLGILEKLHKLGIDFIFNDPVECNLNLVREFYANWFPRSQRNQVKIRRQVVDFSASALN